jgi:hypothetical protein
MKPFAGPEDKLAGQFHYRVVNILKPLPPATLPPLPEFTPRACQVLYALTFVKQGKVGTWGGADAYKAWRRQLEVRKFVEVDAPVPEIVRAVYTMLTPATLEACQGSPYTKMQLVLLNDPYAPAGVIVSKYTTKEFQDKVRRASRDNVACIGMPMKPEYTRNRRCDNGREWIPMPKSEYDPKPPGWDGGDGGMGDTAAADALRARLSDPSLVPPSTSDVDRLRARLADVSLVPPSTPVTASASAGAGKRVAVMLPRGGRRRHDGASYAYY